MCHCRWGLPEDDGRTGSPLRRRNKSSYLAVSGLVVLLLLLLLLCISVAEREKQREASKALEWVASVIVKEEEEE
ncbi:hypothetical protein ACLB2K_052377 [Fragaria x ananassa]